VRVVAAQTDSLGCRKLEQSLGICHQQLLLHRRIGSVERDQIHQNSIIRHDLHIGMRPIGPPQHPIGRVVDQALCERHRVVERRPSGGSAFEPGDLDPAFFVAALQCQQRLEFRIVETFAGIDGAHVVDNIGNRQRGEDRSKLPNRAGLQVDIDMPADAGGAVDQTSEGRHIADAAEPLEEGKAAAADASLAERR
jgi:hypothetical protein